jgi:hypothetical protein
MRIIINNTGGVRVTLEDVDPDWAIDQLRRVIQIRLNINAQDQNIWYIGRKLTTGVLRDYQVVKGNLNFN